MREVFFLFLVVILNAAATTLRLFSFFLSQQYTVKEKRRTVRSSSVQSLIRVSPTREDRAELLALLLGCLMRLLSIKRLGNNTLRLGGKGVGGRGVVK